MKLKKLNEKPRKEQMLLLLLLSVGLFALLALSGCGGGSCETPGWGQQDFDIGKVSGCSVPGCGGCLSSGSGCNTACWPQSCKFIKGSLNTVEDIEGDEQEGAADDTAEDFDSSEKNDIASITACDIRYYGDGCLGCGQKEKTCYFGYMNASIDEEDDYKGVVYGSSDNGEKIIGCSNGCGGCYGTDGNGIGKEYIDILETMLGVK